MTNHSLFSLRTGGGSCQRGPFLSSARRRGALHLGEDVLVLRVAEGESTLGVFLSHDEGQPFEAGHERHEGGRPVVVLARCDRSLPLAEVEPGVMVPARDGDLAERCVRVLDRKPVGGGPLGGNREPFSLLEDCSLDVLRDGGDVLLSLRLAVEQYFDEAAAERAEQSVTL